MQPLLTSGACAAAAALSDFVSALVAGFASGGRRGACCGCGRLVAFSEAEAARVSARVDGTCLPALAEGSRWRAGVALPSDAAETAAALEAAARTAETADGLRVFAGAERGLGLRAGAWVADVLE